MNSVYTALSGANGYLKIKLNDAFIVIYTTPKTLTMVDFTKSNRADYNNFEILLDVIDDFKLHKSSNCKEGFHQESVNVKNLGNFSRYK